MKFDAVGIGNPMLDVLVRVEDKTIEELGFVKGMFNLVSKEKSDEIMEKVRTHGFEVDAGDATANCLAGLANLGCNCGFIGKIGSDDRGEEYIKKSERSGINSLMSKSNEVPTGMVIALITPDSQRTFVTFLGASLTLKVDDIPDDVIENSSYLHITGYQIDDPNLLLVAKEALKRAKGAGVKISIDVADKGVVARNKEILSNIINEMADVVFLNEEEGAVYTGKSDFEEMIKELAPLAETVCLKIGAEGSYVAHRGVIEKIPPVKVKAQDTTGAGDSYASGVLYGLIRGLPIPITGKIASTISAHIVGKIGARTTTSLMSLFDNDIINAIKNSN